MLEFAVWRAESWRAIGGSVDLLHIKAMRSTKTRANSLVSYE